MNICTYERGHPYTAEGIDGPFIFITHSTRTGISRIEHLATGEQVSLKLPEMGDPWMHPVPERLRTMAGKFEVFAENEANRVEFSAANALKNGCGTVACHAGWAGIALGVRSSAYQIGAKTLSRVLNPWWVGASDFPLWAFENPKLWGNTNGGAMFHAIGHFAFGFDKPGQCTLADIANHYREVAVRIEESFTNA